MAHLYPRCCFRRILTIAICLTACLQEQLGQSNTQNEAAVLTNDNATLKTVRDRLSGLIAPGLWEPVHLVHSLYADGSTSNNGKAIFAEQD